MTYQATVIAIIILMWIIFVVRSEHTHALFLRINLSFRINTKFIGIFYFYHKKLLWKAHITRNAIYRKIKVSE